MAESLEDLYEEAPCGFLSLLPDGEIIRVNRTLLSWTGYSAEELYAGKRVAALFTVPSALLYQTYCVPLLRMRGCIGEIALDLSRRDGTPLPVLLSAAVVRGKIGASSFIRVVVLNAPKRREYERELLLARTQAEEAAAELRVERELAERKVAEQDALLQAVARIASGDLTTPVGVDPGSSLSPLAGALDRMRQDILGRIREMAERNAEIMHLNAELRHQIQERSRFFVESLNPAASDGPISGDDDGHDAAPPTLHRGALLANRYRVESFLGQGGMGMVYEVARISDGRRFAAKVLSVRPDLHTMARFAREAQLLARIHHPQLIAIVDVDITTNRVASIIMELVRGSSLAELDARYRDVHFLLPVLGQVADALTAVHSAAVVHRDLKPGNVLISISEDGERVTAKLTDFGIARLLDIEERAQSAGLAAGAEERAEPLPPRSSKSSKFQTTFDAGSVATPASARPSAPAPLTQAGSLVGTLYYMAPELRRGANLAQPASDIFSFGVMAYEVLAGTLPFAKPPLLLAEPGSGDLEFEPLDTMCPGLSPELSRLIERCLAVDPASRPTASELSDALSRGLARGPVNDREAH